MPPWIERSWQRCLNLGLQAHEPVTFDVLSPQHMRRTAEANQRLVQAAKPILEALGRAIANTRYFALLTNTQGMVVEVSGQIDRSDPRAHNITRIGTDLSERSVGTTAIGAALMELQPVWLHRKEHFFSSTSMYSCAGAPLFGPDGDGWITGANQIARQMLPKLAAPGQQAVHASEVFGIPFELLFDAVRCRDASLEIPLWTGLRLQALPMERLGEGLPIQARLRASDKLPLKAVETALIHEAVDQARGNVAQAARALGISRATVYRKLGHKKPH